jgi:hypothetical protein
VGAPGLDDHPETPLCFAVFFRVVRKPVEPSLHLERGPEALDDGPFRLGKRLPEEVVGVNGR